MTLHITRDTAIACFILSVVASSAHAQGGRDPRRAGKRELLPRDVEIALALSAAPAIISDSAAIYVFTDSGYVLAIPGRSGAACYVSRSWPTSLEPHCFDAEGAESVMRIHMREVELLHHGMTPDEAWRELAPIVLAGKLRLPRSPAMSWMLSAEQKLISDDGRAVGRWRPHVMIYYPHLENLPISGAPDGTAGMVSGAGTSLSSIIVVVNDFVAVRATTPQ